MDLGQLRALTRDWLDDEVAPFLWSDDRIDDYLNEAVREAAVRARLLLDSTTAAVCQIALVIGQADYTLHPSIIFVRRAVADRDPQMPLTRARHATMDDNQPRWRAATGRPRYLIPDLQVRKFSLSPVPDAVDTLRLTVVRYPVDAEILILDADEPPIDPLHHEKLCHWVCWRALTKRDAERYSPDEANTHLGHFEAAFGRRPSAQQLMSLATEPTTSTQSYFF